MADVTGETPLVVKEVSESGRPLPNLPALVSPFPLHSLASLTHLMQLEEKLRHAALEAEAARAIAKEGWGDDNADGAREERDEDRAQRKLFEKVADAQASVAEQAQEMSSLVALLRRIVYARVHSEAAAGDEAANPLPIAAQVLTRVAEGHARVGADAQGEVLELVQQLDSLQATVTELETRAASLRAQNRTELQQVRRVEARRAAQAARAAKTRKLQSVPELRARARRELQAADGLRELFRALILESAVDWSALEELRSVVLHEGGDYGFLEEDDDLLADENLDA
jgi:hypothetical protein